MAYKCIRCGNIFEFGEEAEYKEPYGTITTGCPLCGSSYAVTTVCKKCNGEYLSEELFPGGICKDCLLDTITPKNTAMYVENNDLEKHFYTDFFFDAQDILDIAKREFFDIAESEEIGMGEKCAKKCLLFVNEDEASLYDYAEWLVDKEV